MGMDRQSPVQPLRVICRSCGTVNDFGEKYCGRCWADLRRGRVVTVAESQRWLEQRARRAQRRLWLRRSAWALLGAGAVALGVVLGLRVSHSPGPLPAPTSNITAAAAPGQWVSEGYDLQQTRAIDASYPRLAGQVKWRYKASEAFLASPTVSDGIVYVATGDGVLAALDQGSGAVIWRVDGLKPLDSSPVVAGDLLYLGLRNGELRAFDRRSGDLRWGVATSGPIITSPTVVGGEVFVGTGGNMVHSFDAATGQERWHQSVSDWVVEPISVEGDTAVAAAFRNVYFFDIPSGRKVFTYQTVSGRIIGPPVIKDDAVYFLLESGFVLAVDLNARGAFWERPLRRVWGQLYLWGLAPQPPAPRGLIWSYRGPGRAGSGGLAVSRDTIYFITAQGRLVAVDRTTQRERWTLNLGGFGETAPTLAGNTLYIGSGPYLYAIDVTRGEPIWKVRLDGRASTNPVVTPEAVYIGDQAGNLYAVQ